MMPSLLNTIIASLQVLFIFSALTIEKEYCLGPLDPTSNGLLVKQTYDFSIKYNPLFHNRPEWIVSATCIHANYFWIVYSLIFFIAITDGWNKTDNKMYTLLRQVIVPTLLGCKLNAILFYHYMEFTSDTPPPNLIAYFSAEGSYLISIGLVYYQLFTSATTATTTVSASSSATSNAKQE